MKVKQKPAEADAIQYLGLGMFADACEGAPKFSEATPGWVLTAMRDGVITVSGMFTDALGVVVSETCMATCNAGDWLVRTDTGALAVLDDKTFRATYEAVAPRVFDAPVASL